MTDLLHMKGVSLERSGPTLSIHLAPGESLAILGTAGPGKERLLRIAAAIERPPHGRVHLRTSAVVAGPPSSRRATPQSLARAAPGGTSRSAAEGLAATGLWEHRRKSVHSLHYSQAVAAELIPCLAAGQGLLAIAHQLDRLDPWVLASVVELLERRLKEGSGMIVVTDRTDVAAQCDYLVVLKGNTLKFAGRVSALVSEKRQQLEVTSEFQQGVRALVEPFQVELDVEGDNLTLKAKKGQDLAARLLREGYGDVKFVVTRMHDRDRAIRELL